MIVAAGCSFTSSDFKSYEYPDYDVSFKKWPEIIADKFNTTLVNFAKCGYGNDYILDKTIPFILENYQDIDLVVIGWTEASRFNIYHQHFINPIWFLDGEDGDWYSLAYEFLNTPYSVAQSIWSKTDIDKLVDKLYEEYNTLIRLCQVLNIKHVFGQMLKPLEPTNIKYGRHNYRTRKVDDRNFLEHPTLGLSIYEYMIKDKDKYTVGPLDPHPNEEGHIMIADKYLEKYEELYD